MRACVCVPADKCLCQKSQLLKMHATISSVFHPCRHGWCLESVLDVYLLCWGLLKFSDPTQWHLWSLVCLYLVFLMLSQQEEMAPKHIVGIASETLVLCLHVSTTKTCSCLLFKCFKILLCRRSSPSINLVDSWCHSHCTCQSPYKNVWLNSRESTNSVIKIEDSQNTAASAT